MHNTSFPLVAVATFMDESGAAVRNAKVSLASRGSDRQETVIKKDDGALVCSDSRTFLEVAGSIEPAGKLAADCLEECQTARR